MTKEQEVIASFIANFKKVKKTANPIEYAEYCKKLVEILGSTEEVAKKLEVGKETIRILSKVSELPPEVKELISKKLLPLTVAFDIVPLPLKKQVEAAKAVVGLSYREAREVIKRISQNPHKSPESIRSEVLKELENKEIDIVMMAFPDYVLELLRNESQDIPALVTRIVDDWLKHNYPLESYLPSKKQNLISVVVKLPRKTFAALRKRTRNPANLIERIIITWTKQKGVSK
jgi:hypothetical protein